MVTSQPEIAAALEAFIQREFRIINSSKSVFRDEHLFEGGYVDSAGVVELILFIESTFNVKLEDEHVFSEYFTTINGIAELVAGATATAHGSRPHAGQPRAAVP